LQEISEMIETIQICSHCKKQVPNECDGILYFIKEWGEKRKLCKGEMEEDDSFKIINGEPYFHFVRGCGEAWYVPLFKVS
jgi:hypothetical protein